MNSEKKRQSIERLYTNSSDGDSAPVSGRHGNYDNERRHSKTTYHDWAERQSHMSVVLTSREHTLPQSRIATKCAPPPYLIVPTIISTCVLYVVTIAIPYSPPLKIFYNLL